MKKGAKRVSDPRPRFSPHPVLELAMLKTRISIAPTAVNSSMTFAMRLFSTIELTATQPSSSSAVIVAARLPGVISVAFSRSERRTLYWQRTYFWAAKNPVSSEMGKWGGFERKGEGFDGDDDYSLMTPRIREAMRSTSFWSEGCFDLMSTAVLSTTVSMAMRPAAFMVSPDSGQACQLLLQ